MPKLESGYKSVKWYYSKFLKIPSDWEIELLDDVAKRGSGHTPNTRISEYYNGGIKWVSLNDTKKLDKVYISDTTKEISQKGLDNSSAVVYPKGTVVLSRDATIGKSAILTTDMAISQSLMAWQCGKKLDNYYLYYFLQSWKQLFKAVANGTTLKTIGYPFFRKLKIILPSISEQQKISSILLNLDKTLWKYDEHITQTKRLKKGLMQQLLTKGINHKKFKSVKWLFGKEIKIPKEWEIKKLFEICEKEKDIVAGPFGSNLVVSDYKSEGVPIIRLQNIDRNQFVEKNIQFISKKKAEELKYHSYMPEDLVLAKLGDPIGKTCKIPKDFPAGIVVADVVRIRTSNKKSNRRFIEYVLNSEECSKQYNRERIGTTRPRVNLSQIRNLIFPCPPIEEQEKIASILKSVDSKIDRLESKKTDLENLKKGLMQKLLTGQIRVKV